MDDLKERLRANGLDEYDEAIDRIEVLEARIAKADAMAEALTQIANAAMTSKYKPHPEKHGAAGGTVIVLAVAMIAALVFALILSVRLM